MKYNGTPNKIGQPCVVRVRGFKEWLAAVWTGSDRARITEQHAVWFGAEVSRDSAQIKQRRPDGVCRGCVQAKGK